MYAKNAEINEVSRADFYAIVEQIERQIILNSDSKSTASLHDSVFSEVAENLASGFLINEFAARQEERREEEAIKNGIESRKIDPAIFEGIANLTDLLSDSETSQRPGEAGERGDRGDCGDRGERTQGEGGNPAMKDRPGQMMTGSHHGHQTGRKKNELSDPFRSANDSEDRALERKNSLEKDPSDTSHPDGGPSHPQPSADTPEIGLDDIEEDEDDYVDPLDGLSSKELRKRLPPYIFMSNKRKKKYFKSLSKSYSDKVQSRKITKEPNRRVEFKLEDNLVSTFHKNDKIL